MGRFEDAIRATRTQKEEARARADAMSKEHAATFEERRMAANDEYVKLIWPVLREAQRDLERQNVPVKTDMVVNPLKPSFIAIGADHSNSKSTVSIVRRDDEPYFIFWDAGGRNVQEWNGGSDQVVQKLEEMITAAIGRSVS